GWWVKSVPRPATARTPVRSSRTIPGTSGPNGDDRLRHPERALADDLRLREELLHLPGGQQVPVGRGGLWPEAAQAPDEADLEPARQQQDHAGQPCVALDREVPVRRLHEVALADTADLVGEAALVRERLARELALRL